MKILTPLLVMLLLSACHNNRRQAIDYQTFIDEQGLPSMHRVQHFKFQGWQPLDDRYLILRSNQRRSYLVKLMSTCVDLPFAQTIKVKQDSMTMLNAKFDSIEVPGTLNQECTIHSIYPMDKLQRQAVLDWRNERQEIRG